MIYISLGSNLGDRAAHLQWAVSQLKRFLDSVRCSSIIETEPWGSPDQPFYLNQVISGECSRPPKEFLRLCLSLEKIRGRIRDGKAYAPRPIDIDLIDYNGLVLRAENLTLPHPWLHERLFVLEPLAEISPNWICPKTGRSVCSLIEDLKHAR